MKSRNLSLDTLRFILCIFVIIIHSQTKYTTPLHSIVRCAVPCFFLISGYMTYDNSKETLRKNILRSARKIVNITLISFLTFFIFDSIEKKTWSIDMPSARNILFYNIPPWGGHLWYLLAYCNVLVTAYLLSLTRIKCWKTICFILLTLCFILGKYNFIFIDFIKVNSQIYSRNWLFTGLPFFLIGYILKAEDYINYKTVKFWYIACAVFTLLSLVEISFFKIFNLRSFGELFISNIPLTICIFILFIRRNQNKDSVYSMIGRKYSLYIYIYHWIFCSYISFFEVFIHNSVVTEFFIMTKQFIILFFSIILSIIHLEIANQIKAINLTLKTKLR